MTKQKSESEADALTHTDVLTAATSLPSPNIVHADVFENQMNNSLHAFGSGIVALQGEMEGQQRAYEAAQAELTQKHETARADLERRIADLEKAKRMAEAAIDAATKP